MANTGFKGIDVRQTGSQIVFRASLKDSSGVKVTTGTTTLAIYELQSDGTVKSYDFNDNTFKTTALTTGTASMTHRTGNNSTVNTGVWTYALSTLTGLTAGALYLTQINNSGASPTDQEREFLYGSAEGDLVVTANGTGIGELNADTRMVSGTTQTARDLGASVLLSAGSGAGQLDFTAGVVKANAMQWLSGTIPVVNVAGVPKVDLVYAGGSAATFDANNLLSVNAKDFGGTVVTTLPLTGAQVLTAITGGSNQFAVDVNHGVTLTAGSIQNSTFAAYAIDTGQIAPGALIGKGDWPVGKTGYSLSNPQTFNLTGSITGSMTGNVGGNVLGNVVGSVGGVTGGATSANQTTILNAVNAITTNVARGKLVLPYWLVRPAAGSLVYELDLNIYTLQGQLEAPDAAPTIHARNSAGTSLDAGLSSTTMTLISTGKYKVTYTVASTDTAQEALFDATWAVGGVSFAVSDATEIQDAELTATTAAIKAKTDLIATNGMDSPNEVTAQGLISTNLNATVSSRATLAGQNTIIANQTNTANANVVQWNGSTADSTLVLNLKQLNVINNSGSAMVLTSTGGNGHGIVSTGNGIGEGMHIIGGSSGNGMAVIGHGSAVGLLLQGFSAGMYLNGTIYDIQLANGSLNGLVGPSAGQVPTGTNPVNLGTNQTLLNLASLAAAQVTLDHGSGSYASGGIAPTVQQIDAQLSTTHGAAAWGSSAVAGIVSVNQNTGGTGNMTVQIMGAPQSGVTIVAYLQSDYAAGNVGASFVKGEAVSDTNGHWAQPILLATGTYAFTFNLSGYVFPVAQNVVVA